MSRLLRLCLIIQFYCIFNSYSQTPSVQWQKTLGGNNYDQAYSICETFDRGFAVAGISTSNNGNVTGNHGSGDLWIVRLDSTGSVAWQKCFGGSADDGAFALEQTPDSGFIVAGSSTSVNGNVTGNHGSIDFWIIKIDKAGNLLWQKSLGGSAQEIPYSIHRTNDAGYIVAGYTNSADGNISFNHGFNDYWIVKLDSTGTIQWERTFGGSDDDKANSVTQTTDSGYIVCGYTSSVNGDITSNHGNKDYWILKLDSSGTLLWQKTLGGTLEDQARSIIQSADGNYVVTGFTASSDGDVSFNHGFEDLWTVKLDSLGIILWEKSLGGSGVDQAYFISQANTGGYLIAGSSYSLNGDVSGNHGGYDFWIVKTDTAGNIDWEKSLGGTSVEEAFCIHELTNGDFIVAGGTLSNDGDVTSNHGDSDYWVIKLSNTLTGINEELSSSQLVRIYPNPCDNFVTVKYSCSANPTISIFDITGNCQSKHNFQEETVIDLSDFESGIYTLVIYDEQQGKVVSKLVKR